LVGAVGIEPTTFGLKGRCSTTELRPYAFQFTKFTTSPFALRFRDYRISAGLRRFFHLDAPQHHEVETPKCVYRLVDYVGIRSTH
jgi:hypothetical protein